MGINVVYIWLMIPLCILISKHYPYRNVCVVSIGMVAVNALSHIIFAIFMWKYNPGFLTSVFLLMPYCYCTMRKMIQRGFMETADIGLAIVYGFICHVPMQAMTFIASFGNLIQGWQMVILYLALLLLINMTYFVEF